eukprot:jgi/Mesvir1/5056/Mv26081-RA.1
MFTHNTCPLAQAHEHAWVINKQAQMEGALTFHTHPLLNTFAWGTQGTRKPPDKPPTVHKSGEPKLPTACPLHTPGGRGLVPELR